MQNALWHHKWSLAAIFYPDHRERDREGENPCNFRSLTRPDLLPELEVTPLLMPRATGTLGLSLSLSPSLFLFDSLYSPSSPSLFLSARHLDFTMQQREHHTRLRTCNL